LLPFIFASSVIVISKHHFSIKDRSFLSITS